MPMKSCSSQNWLQRPIRCLLLLSFLSIGPHAHAQDSAQYQQLLLELADVVESTRQRADTGVQSGEDIVLAQSYILQLSEAELQFMMERGLPLDELRARLNALNALISQLPPPTQTTLLKTPDSAPPRADSDLIEFPDPEVEISACADTSPTLSRAALATKTSLEALLEGLKWPCREAVFGFNSALACLGPELLAQAAAATFRGSNFCLGEHSSAGAEARLETERNIGAHLNRFIDTNSASRASQDSLDQVQTDTSTALDELNTIQSETTNATLTIGNDLSTASAGLTTLSGQSNEAVVRAQDLQQRAQINQIDIEDAQLRSANLQQSAEEIRNDTLALLTQIESLNTRLHNSRSALDARLRIAARDTVAQVLSDPNSFNIRYQAPESQGGELENVREVTIQAIQLAIQLGLPTATASAQLSSGDQAYAQQNYSAAYAAYAQAYRTVVAASGNAPVVRVSTVEGGP